MMRYGKIVTKEKKKHEDEKKVYRMYYDYSMKIDRVLNHNIMAIDRAEKEKVITCTIEFDEQYCINYACRKFIRYQSEECQKVIQLAIEDGIKRFGMTAEELCNTFGRYVIEEVIWWNWVRYKKLGIQPEMSFEYKKHWDYLVKEKVIVENV